MTLKEYIEQHIVPRYEAFDKAHNLTHVADVIERSMTLAKQYDVDTDMVYAIAAYHDLGLCEGRERHHIVSGEIVARDKMLLHWFTPEQISIIKEAVEDHRASNEQAPRSIYGCIVAEADRLIDTDITLRRTVQYGLKHLTSNDREVHYERFLNHLQEKYAEGGYLRLWLPHSDNRVRIDELRSVIANREELRRRFDQIYNEEVSF